MLLPAAVKLGKMRQMQSIHAREDLPQTWPFLAIVRRYRWPARKLQVVELAEQAGFEDLVECWELTQRRQPVPKRLQKSPPLLAERRLVA